MLFERHLGHPLRLAVRTRRKRNEVPGVLVLEWLAISVAEEEVLRILAVLLHMELLVEFRNIAVLRFEDVELERDEREEGERWT